MYHYRCLRYNPETPYHSSFIYFFIFPDFLKCSDPIFIIYDTIVLLSFCFWLILPKMKIHERLTIIHQKHHGTFLSSQIYVRFDKELQNDIYQSIVLTIAWQTDMSLVEN